MYDMYVAYAGMRGHVCTNMCGNVQICIGTGVSYIAYGPGCNKHERGTSWCNFWVPTCSAFS